MLYATRYELSSEPWLRIVRWGRPGCELLVDTSSVERAYARLLAGEEPPRLQSETLPRLSRSHHAENLRLYVRMTAVREQDRGNTRSRYASTRADFCVRRACCDRISGSPKRFSSKRGPPPKNLARRTLFQLGKTRESHLHFIALLALLSLSWPPPATCDEHCSGHHPDRARVRCRQWSVLFF